MSGLDIVIVALLVLWLAGFSFGLGGALIHALIILVFILFLIRLIDRLPPPR